MNSVERDLVTILTGYLHKSYSFNIESDINEIFELANKYTLTPVIGYSLSKANMSNESFDNVLLLAFSRYESQKYIRGEIKRILEENNIKFIFIKGYTLAKYYDEEYLRYSSDVDVIVENDNYLVARDILVNSGIFKMTHYSVNELSLKANNNVSVDLHCRFTKPNDENEALYKDVVYDSNHELSNEYKLFHLISHGAKHVNNGFIAWQFLIDLYYLNKLEMDKTFVYDLLTKGHLFTFYTKTCELIDVLFNDANKDKTTDLYLDFLFHSKYDKGLENKTLNQIGRRGKLGFMIYRIFPDYQTMCLMYPELNDKSKLVLPVYYVLRAIRVFKKNRKGAINELKYGLNSNQENIEKTKELFNRLGI